jgi:hypothetical protein
MQAVNTSSSSVLQACHITGTQPDCTASENGFNTAKAGNSCLYNDHEQPAGAVDTANTANVSKKATITDSISTDAYLAYLHPIPSLQEPWSGADFFCDAAFAAMGPWTAQQQHHSNTQMPILPKAAIMRSLP